MTTFQPHLTPIEMIQRGVFGASYFEKSSDEDFEGLLPELRALALTQMDPFDKQKNAYGVKAGEDYAAWMKAGWIFPEDPLGWFHWYCRFYSGRRHPRDAHQIMRWRNYGERWGRYARNRVAERGYCSSVVLQGLLQWSYDPDKVIA